MNKNLLKQTTDKINKSKLREYENLFELVLSGIIRMDDNEANDFLNNLDSYTINLLSDSGDVLKIDINQKNYKLDKILKYGMNENVDATVKIRKNLLVKKKINE